MRDLIMGLKMPMSALTSSRSVLGEPEPEQEQCLNTPQKCAKIKL